MRDRYPYRRLGPEGDLPQEAPLVEERPFVVRVDGHILATVMLTPVDQPAFVHGFLYNEGIVDDRGQIAHLELCDNARMADVLLSVPLDTDRVRLGKFVVSGCGADMPPDVWDRLPPLPEVSLSREEIFDAVEQMHRRSERYRESGGIHTAALLDLEGRLHVAEDVGRHNAVDKICGARMLEGGSPVGRLLASTGRISAEMATKALRMGVPVVVSRTSPTDTAVRIADREGITVVGYCRRRTMRVYTHPQRIT